MDNRQADLADRFPIPQEKTTQDPVAVQGEIAGLRLLCTMLFGLAFRNASIADRTALADALNAMVVQARAERTARFMQGFSQVLEEATHAVQGS